MPTWFPQEGDDTGDKPSFYRTNWFHPVGREVRRVRSAVGVTDLTSFAKLQVSGPDAIPFIDYISANYVPKVSSYGTRISWSPNQLSFKLERFSSISIFFSLLH